MTSLSCLITAFQPYLFLFTCESLASLFYLEHVETKEITVKLLKITKHTFGNTTFTVKQ